MKFMEILVGHAWRKPGRKLFSQVILPDAIWCSAATAEVKWLCPHSPAGSGTQPWPQTHFDAFTTLRTHLVTSFLTFRVGG